VFDPDTVSTDGERSIRSRRAPEREPKARERSTTFDTTVRTLCDRLVSLLPCRRVGPPDRFPTVSAVLARRLPVTPPVDIRHRGPIDPDMTVDAVRNALLK
jgi:hypothetical protein